MCELVTLITSFNEKLFKKYAFRLIDTFEEMSTDCNLLVIFEGDVPSNINKNLKKTKFVKLDSKDHEFFLKKFGKLGEANGFKIDVSKTFLGRERLSVSKHMKYDLIKFAFKIFSLDFAQSLIGKEVDFAWIDADTVCLKPFKEKDLNPFFPSKDKNQIMAYLGRTHFPKDNPYSECGFLAFNSQHLHTKVFLTRMKDIYMSGEAFSFTEWHDSWLWDQARIEFENNGFLFKNLSGPLSHMAHPFVNSGLGQYFDHLKGEKRKKKGRSNNEDFYE